MNKKKIDADTDEYYADLAVCRTILLAFKKNFKYDYKIPDSYYIIKRLNHKITTLDICPSLKLKLLRVIDTEWKDEYSTLERFMSGDSSVVRAEWFFLWGTLFTWRNGERTKSVKLMKQYLTEEEQKDIVKVWEVLKVHNLDYNKNCKWWND